MKKLLFALVLVLAVACVLGSCKSPDLPKETTATIPQETPTEAPKETTPQPPEETTPEASEGTPPTPLGLAYEVNADGKPCTVTGLGSCTDTEIYIGDTIDGYRVTAIG